MEKVDILLKDNGIKYEWFNNSLFVKHMTREESDLLYQELLNLTSYNVIMNRVGDEYAYDFI